MKKALSPSAAEKLRFAAAVLPLSLAVCLAIPEMGFLSSFPFIVLIPFGVAFYYDEPLFLSITGALSAAIVSIAADKNGVYTVWFVIISVVVILLSVFAARLIKEHNRQRIRLRIVLAYLLLIAMCVGYGFCLGNPVLALLSRNHVKNYLKTNYSTETFSSICPGYDVMQGAYIHSCAVHTNGEIHTVQVITKGKTVLEDGYFDYVSGRTVDRARTELMTVIRTVTDSPLTPYTTPSVNGPDALTETLSSDGDNLFLYPYLNHYIAFDFETPIQSQFSDACEPIVKAILESGISFSSITFFGGKGQKTNTFMYQLTITPETDVTTVSYQVIPFDEEAYQELQNP